MLKRIFEVFRGTPAEQKLTPAERDYAEAKRRIIKARAKGVFALDLSDLTELTAVPPEIGLLGELRDLSFRASAPIDQEYLTCKLSSLPPEVGQLFALTRLDLGGNQLLSLPPEVGQLSSLIWLNLYGNQLTNVPPEVGRLSALTYLSLYGNQLTNVPPEIGQLSALTWLNLGDNRLTSVPPEVGQLSSLTSLELSNNQLTRLPLEIGQLTVLTSLNLRCNQLTNLPSAIGQLSALTSLDLTGNQLTSLPSEIGQLSLLSKLSLGWNQLTSLPAESGQLSALAWLYLNDNKLTSLPSEIGRLPYLNRLDLGRNQLTSLPREFLALRHLEALRLHGNPSLGIMDEVLGPDSRWEYGDTPPAEILAAYFALYPEALEDSEPQPLHELRVLILGDGAVGKTSLLRQLIGNEAALPHQEKTAGIAIATWPLTAQGQGITAHVWDFGGQGEMHAAHPYFFGQRTLYLLVVEGRTDHLITERLGYWLDMVQAHAGKEARVLIIQNKADQHTASLDETHWRERHQGLPEAAAFHEVSCLTGKGIAALRTAIVQQAEQMPSVWELWPQPWLKVKAEVASRWTAERPMLSREAFDACCAEQGIADAIQQLTLLKLLHDLGSVVAYPDDLRLASLGVMDPNWVREGVYLLLNHPVVADRKGVLLEADLPHLSGMDAYQGHQRLGLMQLMVKFELAFASGEGWVVPGLLERTALSQARQPPFTLADKPLRFEFHYEMLPETLITRFIARKHAWAMRDGSALAAWWRHGMLLEADQCPALVLAQPGRHGRITIMAAGPENRRRDVITLLRHAIDELHSAPQREVVQWMVPLPDHPELAVEYERLLHLEEQGIASDFVIHGGRKIRFVPAQLLEGVGRALRGDVTINQFHGDAVTYVEGDVHGGAVGGLAAVIDRRAV